MKNYDLSAEGQRACVFCRTPSAECRMQNAEFDAAFCG